jgi:hypothetical protein
MNTGLWKMDSGSAAARRPGMTIVGSDGDGLRVNDKYQDTSAGSRSSAPGARLTRGSAAAARVTVPISAARL